MTESAPDAGPVALPDPLPGTLAESHQLLVQFWYRILELEKQVRRRNRTINGPTSARVDIDDIEGEGKEVYEQTVKAIESEREDLGQPPPPAHGGGGRKAPLCAEDEIPRKHKISDPAMLLCPHCTVICTPIGSKVSYQLGFIPARYPRIKHIQYSYGCPSCQEYVITADKPLQPIDGGYPTAELLVHITKSKLEYHLPLYRQEQILLSHSIPIARSTMSRWLKQEADELRILYDRMKKLILQCQVIESDESPMPFIRKGTGKTIQGKIAVYRGDRHAPYNLYNFTEDGKGDNHTRFLPGYKGFLLSDGTSVYNGVLANTKDQRDGDNPANCWANVFRYFEDSNKASSRSKTWPWPCRKTNVSLSDNG